MASLRQILREYLELDDKTVEAVVDLVIEDWSMIILNIAEEESIAENAIKEIIGS